MRPGRRGGGTDGENGLGLAIVKKIVVRHGGSIEAADRTNGARFVVQLPGAEDDPTVP
ncbi:MAG: ATP-binding protein [Acidimicrobiales bacterium]